MTVLVTGGAGYIGSHMVYALVAAGERVVVLDNLTTGFDWAIAEGVPLTQGETGDQELVARIIKAHGIEAIIHFAASIVVPDSVADPLGYYKNNTVNSRALIECAVKGGVKHFIFSSTAAVYGNPARVPVTEDDAPAPMSPYGTSKLMTEIMLRDAGIAHRLGHVILRYFNVAGADPELRTGQSTKGATHLIKVAVETARASRCIALSARRRRLTHGQLRIRPRLFGARSHRYREESFRRRFPCRSQPAPPGRPDPDRRVLRPRPRSARLE